MYIRRYTLFNFRNDSIYSFESITSSDTDVVENSAGFVTGHSIVIPSEFTIADGTYSGTYGSVVMSNNTATYYQTSFYYHTNSSSKTDADTILLPVESNGYSLQIPIHVTITDASPLLNVENNISTRTLEVSSMTDAVIVDATPDFVETTIEPIAESIWKLHITSEEADDITDADGDGHYLHAVTTGMKAYVDGNIYDLTLVQNANESIGGFNGYYCDEIYGMANGKVIFTLSLTEDHHTKIEMSGNGQIVTDQTSFTIKGCNISHVLKDQDGDYSTLWNATHDIVFRGDTLINASTPTTLSSPKSLMGVRALKSLTKSIEEHNETTDSNILYAENGVHTGSKNIDAYVGTNATDDINELEDIEIVANTSKTFANFEEFCESVGITITDTNTIQIDDGGIITGTLDTNNGEYTIVTSATNDELFIASDFLTTKEETIDDFFTNNKENIFDENIEITQSDISLTEIEKLEEEYDINTSSENTDTVFSELNATNDLPNIQINDDLVSTKSLIENSSI